MVEYEDEDEYEEKIDGQLTNLLRLVNE